MEETNLRQSLTELHSASFAWAMACCGDRELAEDVLQSVYLKLLGGKARYRGNSSLRTWLFAVIRNAVRDAQRRRTLSRVVHLDFELFAQLVGSTCDTRNIDEDNEIHAVRVAVAGLPERQRQVAHLVFYENLSVADAAQVMNVSVGTARQHYARAKESLKGSLRSLWRQSNEPVAN